ncbi:MAG: GntR family transcriptional regulator [Actinomycetaceae bacterium]|nr:GntR family transcriptional regulator [Actinomycetaceae bacterium]
MNKTHKVAISIDRKSAIPLYQQISSPLEKAIISGKLPPGELVEDEVSMAKRLRVSRPTVRRAFQDLVNQGYLTRRRGVGTLVTPARVHRPLKLSSLNEDLRLAGFTPTTKVLSYEVGEVGEKDGKILGIDPREGVLKMKRLRYVDGQPLAIMFNVVPLAYAPSWTDINGKGFYACFEEKGVKIAYASQSVSARLADSEEVVLLEEETEMALLTMQRTSYLEDGTVVELGRHVYRPSLYSIRFTLFND